MKLIGFIIIVFLILSCFFDGLLLFDSFNNDSVHDNWNISIDSSIHQISHNISSLVISYNITYFEDIFFPTRLFGGKIFDIYSNNTDLFSLIPPGMIIYNYTQPKGSFVSIYSFFFSKSGTYTYNITNENSFIIPVSSNGTYSFLISLNPEFSSFNGSLSIGIGSTLSLSLKPLSWSKSGLFSSSNNPFLFNDTLLLTLLFFVCIEVSIVFILFIVRKYFDFKHTNPDTPFNFRTYLFQSVKFSKPSPRDHNSLSNDTLILLDTILDENTPK